MSTRTRPAWLAAVTVLVVAVLCAVVVPSGAAVGTGVGRGFDSLAGAGAGAGTGTGTGTGTGAGARPGVGQGSEAGPDPGAGGDGWVGTWYSAPVEAEPGGGAARTVRNVVHTTMGGSRARITVSNLFGTAPLDLRHATLATAAAPARTMRTLTFHGHARISVPSGGQAVSDPLTFEVPAAADLYVSVYAVGPVTWHPQALGTSYEVPGETDRAADPGAFAGTTGAWRYVTALDVQGPESARGSVVVLGDSITEGVGSTPGADRRWTDVLAERLRNLRERTAGVPQAVLNAGIGGNGLLTGRSGPSGPDRFQRDALGRAGVRTVIVELGINDLLSGGERNADALLAGMRDLVRRGHARGVRVLGTTLAPCGGLRACTAQVEAVRETVNAAIRGGGVYEGVIDIDRTLRAPDSPRELSPPYDSGDHLHPSDAGYRAVGAAIDPGAL
ncbi:SGNH/GDSL hydrolase family protein [Streptomyces sp. MBT27]|uniref:SGNH/GDSL hydrolase family protein n=1 Tax=Streptomyces sp. MBT27 TaxID=1488356 RepID=UPI0014208293|nr:SGNH/GDSL hydrolase family protein [Streptomyces sp. MBT27]